MIALASSEERFPLLEQSRRTGEYCGMWIEVAYFKLCPSFPQFRVLVCSTGHCTSAIIIRSSGKMEEELLFFIS